nr:hypothetical protein [Providencia rettgeri]
MKATGKARIKGDKTGAKKCFLRGIFFNSMIEVVCVFKWLILWLYWGRILKGVLIRGKRKQKKPHLKDGVF